MALGPRRKSFELRRCVTALALGAATTILVAWSCAALAELPWNAQPAEGITRIEPPYWTLSYWKGSSAAGVLSYHGGFAPPNPSSTNVVVGPSWSRTSSHPKDDTADAFAAKEGYRTQFEDARGWPFVALVAKYDSTNMGLNAWTIRAGLQIPGRQGVYNMPKALGLRPAWRGLAADSVGFGAAWFAALSLIAWRRRARRIRNGRCAACGYPVSGLGICPECGEAGGTTLRGVNV